MLIQYIRIFLQSLKLRRMFLDAKACSSFYSPWESYSREQLFSAYDRFTYKIKAVEKANAVHQSNIAEYEVSGVITTICAESLRRSARQAVHHESIALTSEAIKEAIALPLSGKSAGDRDAWVNQLQRELIELQS